jgi:hypothetical protein
VGDVRLARMEQLRCHVGRQANRSDFNGVIRRRYEMEDKDKPIIFILIRDARLSEKVILRDEIAHLAMFDLIPPFNEVLHDVKNNGAIDGHVHLNLYVNLPH